ncbi:MAG: hypothetical protein RR290_02365 [Clostridia bacterium]
MSKIYKNLSYKELENLHFLDELYISILKKDNLELKNKIDDYIESDFTYYNDFYDISEKIENLNHQISVLNLLNVFLLVVVLILVFCL